MQDYLDQKSNFDRGKVCTRVKPSSQRELERYNSATDTETFINAFMEREKQVACLM